MSFWGTKSKIEVAERPAAASDFERFFESERHTYRYIQNGQTWNGPKKLSVNRNCTKRERKPSASSGNGINLEGRVAG